MSNHRTDWLTFHRMPCSKSLSVCLPEGIYPWLSMTMIPEVGGWTMMNFISSWGAASCVCILSAFRRNGCVCQKASASAKKGREALAQNLPPKWCFFCCFAPKNKKGISTQPSKIRDLHGFASDQRAKNTWSILVIWSWWEAGDCVGAPFETIVMLYLHNFRSSAVGHTIEMMNNLSIKSWPIMW